MRFDAYYITNETSEDRLDSATTLQDALRIARELVREGLAGDPVCIEHKGLTIRQIVMTPDGALEEEVID